MNSSSEVSKDFRVIQPGQPWWRFDWGEVWLYRHLVRFLVRRDLVLIYKQTILGPLHLFIRPLIMTFLFQLVFHRFGGMKTDGIHPFLFYFINNSAWAFFSGTFGSSSSVFMNGKGLMTKVYFPRIIPSIAALFTNAVNLSIQLSFALILVAVFDWTNGTNYLSIRNLGVVFPILQLSMIGMGFGFCMASLTLKYRDLSSLAGLVTQGLMYLSPVIYPISVVPDKYRILALANPLSSALETLRYFMFSSSSMKWEGIVLGWIISISVLVIGLISFNIVQRKFVDIV